MTNQEKALELHEKLQGKLETVSKTPVRTREDLALVYTPGVAEPCKVIAKDPAAAYTYTMKANTVAVVSDGSAVLGLGNIGPKGRYARYGKVRLSYLKNSAVSTQFPSAWILRTRKRLSKPLPGLLPLLAASTWRISVHPAASKSKSA